MTDAERQAAFRKAIDDAQAQYGYTVAAQLLHEELGPVVQVRPQLVILAVDGWTEPEPKGKADERPA